MSDVPRLEENRQESLDDVAVLADIFVRITPFYARTKREYEIVERFLYVVKMADLKGFVEDLLVHGSGSFTVDFDYAVHRAAERLENKNDKNLLLASSVLVTGVVRRTLDFLLHPPRRIFLGPAKEWLDVTAEFDFETAGASEQLIPPLPRFLDASWAWDMFEKQLNAAFSAYGKCTPRRRLSETLRNCIPYAVLMFAVAASSALDVTGPVRHLSEFLVSAAYAQTKSVATSGITKQDIISYVLLALFAVSFCITLWNEFFSSKPRPISRDLNRAYGGFLIGQIGKIMGS